MLRLWHLLQAVLIYLFTLPIAILPYRLSLRVGSFIGVIGFYLWSSRRKIAIENIETTKRIDKLYTDLSSREIALQSFKNLGKSVVEIIKIFHGLGEGILKRVTIEGEHHFHEAKSKGRGVIFITGHCGNWEVIALTSSYMGTPLAVVARAQNNPYINRFIERARSKFGNRVIYKKGALRHLIRQLRQGGTIGILMDQGVLPSEGVKIPFLGRPAWTMRTPAVLARKTGAAVVPVFIRRTENGHHIVVQKEVELLRGTDEESVIEDTRKMSSYVEDYIRHNPVEWLWIHRRWKRA